MPTLDDLRHWLNIPEAAKWLSDLSKQKVTQYKLLRHALDNQITLSVYFPSGVMVVKDKEEPTARYGLLDLDLSKFGSHRAWVERLASDSYAPYSVQDTDAFLRDSEGTLLRASLDNQQDIYPKQPWHSSLPPDAILCIRAEILEQIKDFLCGKTSELEESLPGNERTSLLLLIGAMLKKHGIDPHDRDTTSKFMRDYVESAGIGTHHQTVRKHLKAAADKLNEKTGG